MTEKPVAMAFRSLTLSNESRISLTHPLVRRMSPLQKVTLELLEQFKAEQPSAFQRLFFELRAPLFFASEFGEIEAIVKEVEAIHNHSLPVSPAAFQHSVQNCAPGYFSIFHRSNVANLSFSSGYLARDKALGWAWQKVRGGVNPAVCVVAAHEETKKGENGTAYAEMFVVTNVSYFILPGQKFLLESVVHHQNALHSRATTTTASSKTAGTAWHRTQPDGETSLFFRENPSRVEYPFFALAEQGGSFVRTVENAEGESLTSVWRAL